MNNFTVELSWLVGDRQAELTVTGHAVPFQPAVLYRSPENCSPAEGGEIEDLAIEENGCALPEHEVEALSADEDFIAALRERIEERE